MAEIEFVGGPFDGSRLVSGLGLPFLWTDGRRCFRRPGRRRSLYRAMGEPMFGSIITRFRFIGHTHVVCECGVLRTKHKSCSMCGAQAVTSGP